MLRNVTHYFVRLVLREVPTHPKPAARATGAVANASLAHGRLAPAGVVAQIQGHKPSATAEKHDKRRPLDLLRMHHVRIEAWMLEHAGIKFTPPAEDESHLTVVGK